MSVVRYEYITDHLGRSQHVRKVLLRQVVWVVSLSNCKNVWCIGGVGCRRSGIGGGGSKGRGGIIGRSGISDRRLINDGRRCGGIIYVLCSRMYVLGFFVIDMFGG